MRRTLLLLLLLSGTLPAGHTITVSGARFQLDGQPFPFTGISFFNAIYNPEFNRSSEARRQWLGKFQKYGINVLRVFAQWDHKLGMADTCATCSPYESTGALRPAHVETLKRICADADTMGMVVEFTLFSHESWQDGIRLDATAADRAVAAITRELLPHRNLTFQVWNEFSERTADHVRTIKRADPSRVVTNSPDVGGVFLNPRGEAEVLDYLSPHTSRQTAGRHWEIATKEIAYLLERYRKPVVDDEPARNGTPKFGGPKAPTSPNDHILQIWQVWKLGAYIIYHHDMFQAGKGAPSVPPSGIPDPEFSPYHKQVLEFIAQRDRYTP